MKLTIQIKLLPNADQSLALRQTLETVNNAANLVSELAWDFKTFGRFGLQKSYYRRVRDEFPLSAQITCLLFAKVADAYKLDTKCQRNFRSHGSIAYDSRILAIKTIPSTASIWSVAGRLKDIPFLCSDRNRKLLDLPRGESDLILRGRDWFLNVSVEVPEAKELESIGWLGIDLGLVNLAQSSDGQTFGNASKVAGIRDRRLRQRRRLQQKGTKSAKRVLRRLSGREQRFMRDVNHVVSKQIVGVAECTKRSIALEDLSGIRSRIKANKKQRRKLHSWAFADLQAKISYKSKIVGVEVRLVDARNTSRTCPACGNISKKNRPTRDTFVCQSCQFSGDSDTCAATEIRRRGAINHPHVGGISYGKIHGRTLSQSSSFRGR